MAVPSLSLALGDDRPDVEAAIRRVLDRGWFILGPEVEAFEAEFAAASGAARAVAVNTGTDALRLILRARLPRFAGWTATRRHLAARYRTALSGADVVLPAAFDPGHVYHLFTVRSRRRDALRAALDARGVGTLVHYPIPVSRQPAFADLSSATGPHADRVAAEILSLPLAPTVTDADVDEVASAVRAAASEIGAAQPA
jgi:dTDP-4-amino-4,6-dideoxygalactose transaminase